MQYSNRGWQQKLADSLTALAPTAPVDDANPVGDLTTQLRAAAAVYAKRTDSFAEGKSTTCLDIAAKVERFGSFASGRQKDFALKLIEWSKPRAVAPPSAALAVTLPKLFAVMQKHAHLHAEPLKLSRKNQDTLVWVMFAGVCVGKIENAVVTLFDKRLGASKMQVEGMLTEFEADPLAAAQKYGKLSGRCCSCGRDLTDPESIEAGIGPVCAVKFG